MDVHLQRLTRNQELPDKWGNPRHSLEGKTINYTNWLIKNSKSDNKQKLK